MSDDAVDLVFTWVDGNDPEWQQLKRSYMGVEQRAATAHDELWGDDTRYRNMEEIVYAVRSANLYAPWLRTIYIVITDGQKLPAPVLATANVVVVPCSAIMPAELLPSFSGAAIESFLHRIPGLSEVFLYANDDFLFWKPTPKSYFVERDRLKLRGYFRPELLARIPRRGHERVATRTAALLHDHGFDRTFQPEHSIHVFRISTCVHAWDQLGAELGAAAALRFNDEDRSLFWQLIVYTYEGQLHDPVHELALDGAHLSFFQVDRSRLISLYVRARLLWLSRFPRHTVCFNTIPPSWYEVMHRYFAMHLEGRPALREVVKLLRATA